MVTNVLLRSVDGAPRRILGLHAQVLSQPPEVLNAFSFTNKRPIQILFLAAMIGVAVTTGGALVLWFRRRRITKRKWWWLLGILFGPFKLSVNWTTGAFAIQALTAQLFSLSATRGGLIGPWLLSLSVPAGAIAFMIDARRTEPPSPPPPAQSPPTATYSSDVS